MQNVKNTMITHLLSLVAPYLCSSCGAEGTLFCDNCKSHIIRASLKNCGVCGSGKAAPLCDDCRTVINRLYIAGVRKGGLLKLIDGFKFRYQKAAANSLAGLVDVGVPVDAVIVPVPTARSHIRQRGYDHTLVLAKALSRRLKVPYSSLLKPTSTVTQHFATRKQRYLQANALYISVAPLDPLKPYLLLDDIITTGSTILAAAHALYDAGARNITAVAIARQPLD